MHVDHGNCHPWPQMVDRMDQDSLVLNQAIAGHDAAEDGNLGLRPLSCFEDAWMRLKGAVFAEHWDTYNM